MTTSATKPPRRIQQPPQPTTPTADHAADACEAEDDDHHDNDERTHDDDVNVLLAQAMLVHSEGALIVRPLAVLSA